MADGLEDSFQPRGIDCNDNLAMRGRRLKPPKLREASVKTCGHPRKPSDNGGPRGWAITEGRFLSI
jgi:hypothetical protein